METLRFFRLRFRRAYDSAYDSDFRFSLGHKLSYDSDYGSVASENRPYSVERDWLNKLSCRKLERKDSNLRPTTDLSIWLLTVILGRMPPVINSTNYLKKAKANRLLRKPKHTARESLANYYGNARAQKAAIVGQM